MTKTLSMVSHKNYNLNAKWGFCYFLTSKLLTCFIDGFTSRRKSQLSIAYLFNESEHIYWILDLETEVHSIWIIWMSNLQECQGHGGPGSGDRDFGFFDATLARCSDTCNARQVFLESPINLPQWSTTSCALALACRPSVSRNRKKKKKKQQQQPTCKQPFSTTLPMYNIHPHTHL